MACRGKSEISCNELLFVVRTACCDSLVVMGLGCLSGCVIRREVSGSRTASQDVGWKKIYQKEYHAWKKETFEENGQKT
jgi:hypothetical protein